MITYTVAEAYQLVQLGDWTYVQFTSWVAAQWQVGYDKGHRDGLEVPRRKLLDGNS